MHVGPVGVKMRQRQNVHQNPDPVGVDEVFHVLLKNKKQNSTFSVFDFLFFSKFKQ